jgi:hypothetical protein
MYAPAIEYFQPEELDLKKDIVLPRSGFGENLWTGLADRAKKNLEFLE